jgi:hypothetical protein
MRRKNSLFVLIILVPLFLLALSISPAQAAGSRQESELATPTPGAVIKVGVPGASVGIAVPSISQIFYKMTFPAETLSKALTNVVNDAAQKEADNLTQEIKTWNQAFAEAITAMPSGNLYAEAAKQSLPAAATLAVALFLLRIAIYQWNRLAGEQDSPTTVIADWVTAGVMAVAAGPLLDLVQQVIAWLLRREMGSTVDLAEAFSRAMTITTPNAEVKTMFFGVFVIGLAIASLVASAGILFAPVATVATMYVMAYIAPAVAILGVIPQLRWVRSLWVKALAVVALCPFAVIGVFRATVAVASSFASSDGLLFVFVRLFLMLGAAGFLLTLVGALGNITISTSLDALKQGASAVMGIASLAVGVATGGVALAGAAAGAVGAAGSALGGISAGGGAGALSGSAASSASSAAPAVQHLQSAERLTQWSGVADAMGLRAPAQYMRSQARQHELAARRLKGSDYSEHSQPETTSGSYRDLGLSDGVAREMVGNFPGTPAEFRQGYTGFSQVVERSGQRLANYAAYSREVPQMVKAYLDHPDEVAKAADPLHEAARLGNTRTFLKDVYGEKPESRSG